MVWRYSGQVAFHKISVCIHAVGSEKPEFTDDGRLRHYSSSAV